VLDALIEDLREAARELRSGEPGTTALASLLRRGNDGRVRLLGTDAR